MSIGEDDCGFASMARYAYLTGGNWADRYKVSAFAWVVPVEYRVSYHEVYCLSLVKGVQGEIADPDIPL